jgi:hypothetical protein
MQAQLQISNARDNAMSNSTVATAPAYGIPVNNAIINNSIKTNISATVLNKYYLSELSSASIGYIKNFNSTTGISFGIACTGTKAASEQSAAIGIAKKVNSKVSIGIKASFHRWQFEDSYYPVSQTILPEVHVVASPIKKLCLGVIIRNPVRSRMNAIEQKLPATIISGFSYLISDKVTLASSLTQKSNDTFSIQSGVEYMFHSKIFIRAGWQTYPLSQSFGFGLNISKFFIDVSIQTQQHLGNNSSVSLIFNL